MSYMPAETDELIRKYHGLALLYGETYAQTWLAKTTNSTPGINGMVLERGEGRAETR